MGCSASKPITVITNTAPENHLPVTAVTTSSESSNSSSPNQNTKPKQITQKALSVTTPLIHHPPIRKGDTHHLVSLTSSTYGYASLLTPKATPFQPKTTEPEKSQFSLSPDSVINTWELMHGLNDDDDGDDLPNPKTRPGSCRFNYASFSSQSSSSSSSTSSKPLWQHLSEESLLSKMDPNVALTYRRALSSRQLSYKPSDDKVVVYFTSLRGVRKTYEDCCAVRAILRGFGVRVDERDVSMDSALKQELKAALGAVLLPRVFVNGRNVGGAEEVKRMNEAGDLAALLAGLRKAEGGFECGVCGEARFVPCGRCRGSRKVFAAEGSGLRRCRDCNENGLVRCTSCC